MINQPTVSCESMNKCQNCGNFNEAASNFCRFCGTKFNIGWPVREPSKPQTFDLAPPKAYSWKSDELTAHRNIQKLESGNVGRATPLSNRATSSIGYNFQCPNCGSTFLPRTERRISTGGWVTFAVLLVFFFPLFWIGFLIKEDIHVCPVCRFRVV